MTTKPLKIGITGGIGTGKTLVSKIFNLLGAPVYNADIRAKWLMSHHRPLIERIKSMFGDASFTHDNQLNRAFLAEKVFNDKKSLETLNALVHPEVARDFESWAKENSTHFYMLKEAALMFEAGSYKTMDRIITVYAPLELRIKRVLQRDKHRNVSDINSIIEKQLTEEDKVKKADFVIYNDDKNMVIPQVLKLHEKFLSGF